MGGFVPLPSPVNPYVSGSEQGAAAAAHAYNSAREAKIQKQRLQQQQQQRDLAAQQTQFMNDLRMHNAEAMPLDVTQSVMTDPTLKTAGSGMFGVPVISDAEAPRDTGMKRRVPNPDIPATRQGTYITQPDPTGQSRKGTVSYLPSASEKATMALNDSNSYIAPAGSDTEAWLQKYAGIKPGTRIANAHLGAITGLAKDMQAQANPQENFTLHEMYDQNGQSAGFMQVGNRGSLKWAQMPGQPGQPGQAPGQSAQPQAGLPGGPFRTDTGPSGVSGDPFAQALLEPAEPTAPAPSPSGAAPAQRTPGKAGALTMRPPARPRTTSDKETPNDWVRIKTDPKSSPDEVKRATAALAESRAGQTEADQDRHARQKELADDKAERLGERATDRADREAKENRRIETEKKKGIDAANKKYRTAMQTAFTPEAKKQALEELRSDLDETQGLYESATGSKIHSTWGKTYDPNARDTDPAGIKGKKADPLGVRK